MNNRKPIDPALVRCSDAIEEMYQFLDGELPPEAADLVSQHLQACLSCFEAFDFEAELKQVIAGRCVESPPPHLHVQITAMIEQFEAEGIPPH